MRDLTGRHILIVEDEYLLASDLADEVERHGAQVTGPVSTVGEGLRLVRDDGVDGAILDVNLQGESVFPLADELIRRHIPFVFATGYDDVAIPDRFAGVSLATKPVIAEQVLDLL